MRVKNTLIMAVIVVLLAGFVYFTEIRGSEERAEAERVASRLLQFESADVTSLTIESAEQTIVMARTDEGWRITAPYELAADDAAIDGIVTALQNADHDRLIDEQPDDLAPFGLDDPALRATLTFADGDTQSIDIGAGTPVGSNVFVRGRDGGVYTTAATLETSVGKSLVDLRDRRILTFTGGDVARLQIVGADLDATLQRQPDMGDGISRWRMTAPLDTRADADTISALLNRLQNDRATAYPAEDPNDEEAAAFGLVDPETVVTVWTHDDAAHTLEIGAAAADESGRYARRRGSSAVFIVPTTLVDALPESADDLRNRTVVELARDRVEGIELARGNDRTNLEKDGIDWRVRQPLDVEGDSSTVSALLSAVLDLRARGFANAADATRFGFEQPWLEAIFRLEPGFDAAGGGTEPLAEGAAPTDTSASGETVRLLIGAATEVDDEPDDEGNAEKIAARFVSVEGAPDVYYVAQEDLDGLDVGLFELRSKTVVSFTQGDLTRLELTDEGGTYQIEKNEEGTWTLGGPAVSVDIDTAVVDMLWNFNYLRMEGIVAEWEGDAGPPLADYGLEPPRIRLAAYVGDERVASVSIGAEAPTDAAVEPAAFAVVRQTYARVDGLDAVLRIDAKLRDSIREILAELS